jgi:serine/threonine-protein kinase
MDYVDGLDAARLLASRFQAGMPIGQVVSIVTAVAAALDYAHRRGLLHRDVKPANIMLTELAEDEDQRRVLLTDFGIARNIDDIGGLTATNMTLGTVAYSAPEQLMGQEVDGRADQYGLAATAFHLLTGRQLFPHSNPAVVISHHLNSPPPALGDTHPELAALDQVFAIAFAKNPANRFSQCKDFAYALASAGVATGDANPDRNAPPPHCWFSWAPFTASSDGLVIDATTEAPPTEPASAAGAMNSGAATAPRHAASAAPTTPPQTSAKSRWRAAARPPSCSGSKRPV